MPFFKPVVMHELIFSEYQLYDRDIFQVCLDFEQNYDYRTTSMETILFNFYVEGFLTIYNHILSFFYLWSLIVTSYNQS